MIKDITNTHSSIDHHEHDHEHGHQDHHHDHDSSPVHPEGGDPSDITDIQDGHAEHDHETDK